MAEDTNTTEGTTAPAELTPAQLKQKVASLTRANEKLEAENGKIKEAHQATKDALTAETVGHATTKQQLADAQEELATANGIVEEVSQRLANADAISAESGTHVLTFEKQQYKVLAPTLQHKGVKYEAKDLSKYPEVLKDLIGDGKGLVQPITAAKE
jgi:cellobiose-specific phosphotransferase system component IIA